jgi:dolichol-phosphate mannosyltransferase
VKLSIVIPLHDEEELIPELLTRLRVVVDGLDRECEVVLVDDGSTDGSWQLLRSAAEGDGRIRAISLSRNFGHQVALSAGLRMARGDAVITMDGDLQHPPELIPRLVAKGDEDWDVVYAVRSPLDSESRFKIASAHLFYWVLNRLTRLNLPHGSADFRFMSRRVVAALVAMPERSRFLRGMTRWVGYKQTALEYERVDRAAGRSKYTLRHMFGLAFDAIMSFSAIPLRIASVLGFIISALGFVYLIYVLGIRFLTDTAVPGWTSVTVAVLLLGGAQLACLGIIGQYLGRMYDEAKGRPLFLIAEDTGEPGGRHSDASVLVGSVGDPDG